ncbi:hypothetical protein [Streptomyces sp. NL15-2K]|uniref:hypothetical protein n=1 Tax=Streptomyces sp. NL15-2K TaxID=376149 RepID=UPI000FFA9B3B|nr:hypothetical protein [Kutzneria buriramensis]WKX15374.1 hypothetical protein Q4V64_50940 [Kutzneria buriramensis]GCB43949.1 hypothetical protein SNL152K_1234 [Streptomyces sp. NL15-2K]
MLGLGFGGGQGPGTKRLAAMTAYLDEMDAVETPNPLPKTPMRRIMAAYGPKMLELARERTAGAQTYHVNVAHTAQAREILGPDAFLGVEHAVLFESDPDKARAVAREHLNIYLNSPYNIAKFRRLGYSEEEIAGGSDRIVDDLVFWGDLDTIVEKPPCPCRGRSRSCRGAGDRDRAGGVRDAVLAHARRGTPAPGRQHLIRGSCGSGDSCGGSCPMRTWRRRR